MKTREESAPMKISKVDATLPIAQVITITTPVYVQHSCEHTQYGDSVGDADVMETNNDGFGLDLESQIIITNRLNEEFSRARRHRQQPQMCNNPMFISYNYNGYVMSSEDLFYHRIKVLCASFCIIIFGLSVVGSVLNS